MNDDLMLPFMGMLWGIATFGQFKKSHAKIISPVRFADDQTSP